MPTKHSPPQSPGPVVDRWSENYAKIPLWLIRGCDGLTHAQFHVLVVFLTVLGGRKGWWHIEYRRLAELACTDTATVTRAVHMFIDAGWLEVKGPPMWRQYKLHREVIERDIFKQYEDDSEEGTAYATP